MFSGVDWTYHLLIETFLLELVGILNKWSFWHYEWMDDSRSHAPDCWV